MRTAGSEELFSSICDKLGEVHAEGIASYGSDNDMRLTGSMKHKASISLYGAVRDKY